MIWILKKAGMRSVHHLLRGALPLLNFPIPELRSGPGSLSELPQLVKAKGLQKPLLVTDKGIMKLGLLEGLLNQLQESAIETVVFDEVQPNPTIDNIEAGLTVYLENCCDGIIAVGGGSPMDCAKMIGARAANPKRSVKKMKGLFKVRKDLPPLFAVPTTAGTGSETTIAAVVSDPEVHEKFAVKSMKIVPQIAILDPDLMVGLPPHITSTTGMDALTHAIEAYIGLNGFPFVNEASEKAVRLIFDNLEKAYREGDNLDARTRMAEAAYEAGLAFTRASVGYVHAIAHNLGGLYGVPHGLANAIVLPYVLELSAPMAGDKMARLAVAGVLCSNGQSTESMAQCLIDRVKSMNRQMNIPETVRELRKEEIPLIAERVMAEAHPDYPVPRILNRQELETLITRLLP